uniref:Uncharacterized protein n=1 Tax=Accipiter nisus TaxID=211598 RepID=A0A8B9MZ64_9AVES
MPGGGGGAAAARGQWFYEVDVATAWGEWLQQHWLWQHRLWNRNACVGLGRAPSPPRCPPTCGVGVERLGRARCLWGAGRGVGLGPPLLVGHGWKGLSQVTHVWGTGGGAGLGPPLLVGCKKKGWIQPPKCGAQAEGLGQAPHFCPPPAPPFAPPPPPPPRYHGFLRDVYRDNMVAAIFTLSCGGGVRFEGQEHWIRPESCWRPEVLRLHDIPVVALDLSSSPLTYNGLDNLVPLTWLQRLDLSRCPHLDNWLSVACCPHVTERGLATLHHLQELWCLDVAGVQAPSPGLVCILLEKMLSGCQILGMDLRDIPPEGVNPLDAENSLHNQ